MAVDPEPGDDVAGSLARSVHYGVT